VRGYKGERVLNYSVLVCVPRTWGYQDIERSGIVIHPPYFLIPTFS